MYMCVFSHIFYSGYKLLHQHLDFCVSSLFLHLCGISLPFHHYYFFYLIVFSFPRLQDEFFLPSGFCPPKVGPAVCVSFV